MLRRSLIPVFALSLLFGSLLRAELRLPAIIGEHMVLQQNQANPIWGWDTPGTAVTVTFAGRAQVAVAGADGKWHVQLPALPASDEPQALTIAGSSKVELRDVLVGEVWVCSGQSNMQFRLEEGFNGDLEAAASDYTGMRLITVPPVGTQEMQDDFKGAWAAVTPATARKFSAVGFFFGRYLHQILGVPVGVINVSWSSSTAESWVRRASLEQDPRFRPEIEDAVKNEAHHSKPEVQAQFEKDLQKWEADREAARASGAWVPNRPANWLKGNQRPGNLFAGMIHPILGYGLKGVIWYQGEGNAARAEKYAELFPFLIEQWRKEWGQGDFPFYWVQIANYKQVTEQPADGSWAWVRESQTKTLRLPKTGQAVIIDLGEGREIHPRNKHEVAARLVRWALVQDYGRKMPYRSPEFKGMEIKGAKITVTFDCFGGALYAFGQPAVRGFAVCGADKVWHWAEGAIRGKDQVEVWSDAVPAPIAVRYAFADNPVCNLYARSGLPATPFRTDNFEFVPPPKPVER